MTRLVQPTYLRFPFAIEENGPRTSDLRAHVREQIEQVLFTDPKERVFRPQFGAGLRTLVFEPNAETLRALVLRRLSASLAEALQGVVDPASLHVGVIQEDNHLILVIDYRLAAIDQAERHLVAVASNG